MPGYGIVDLRLPADLCCRRVHDTVRRGMSLSMTREDALNPRTRPTRPPRQGFTLVELVTSLAILSILLLGMGSAVMVVHASIPDQTSPAATASDTARTLSSIAEELESAIHVMEQTPTAIAVVLPDRDSDGLPEIVRYEWSGTPGDALIRQSGGNAVPVIEDVHVFSLNATTNVTTSTYASTPIETDEMILSSHVAGSMRWEEKVSENQWIGQYLTPALPAGTTSWSVTRVAIKASKQGATKGELTIQLQPAAGGLPNGVVLQEHTTREKDLPKTLQWIEYPFTDATELAPDETLCLVLAGDTNGNSAEIEVDEGNGSGMIESNSQGADWYSYGNQSVGHYLYGKAVVGASTNTLVRPAITSIDLALQVSGNAATRREVAVRLVNRPQVLSALWETDFKADPTLLDLDADGSADWAVSGGGLFDPTGLMGNGIWSAKGLLETNDGYDFNQPTTVDLRLRDTLANGIGGGTKLRVDRQTGSHAAITVDLSKVDAASQRLQITTWQGDFTTGRGHRD